MASLTETLQVKVLVPKDDINALTACLAELRQGTIYNGSFNDQKTLFDEVKLDVLKCIRICVSAMGDAYEAQNKKPL